MLAFGTWPHSIRRDSAKAKFGLATSTPVSSRYFFKELQKRRQKTRADHIWGDDRNGTGNEINQEQLRTQIDSKESLPRNGLTSMLFYPTSDITFRANNRTSRG